MRPDTFKGKKETEMSNIEYTKKRSSDAKEVFKAVARQSCDTMHKICSLMEAIRDVQNNYANYGGSARTPEICEAMMDDAIRLLRYNANCGVAVAGAVCCDNPVEVEITVANEVAKPVEEC